jgi:hypothetical protein
MYVGILDIGRKACRTCMYLLSVKHTLSLIQIKHTLSLIQIKHTLSLIQILSGNRYDQL